MDIIKFGDLKSSDVSVAGGKGASLGEMLNAGIPVPDGFVVSTGAFERFLDEAQLHARIEAILDTVNPDAVHTVEDASEKIQRLIRVADMPGDIAEQILAAFDALDCSLVAVRSSATAEDSASAAWAGQLDSFLNSDRDALLKHVQDCWASLFTPRAIFYRFEKDLQAQSISVAVVVQQMVQSEVSGIAFSVHPVTQDRNQLIIEAGLGLGEAIVSGRITPDSYVVRKDSLEIVEKDVHEQSEGLFGAENGNVWKRLGDDSQKLSDERIIELAKLTVRIEEHYGFPCDIEWAIEDDELFIVQSRPITTLMQGGKLPDFSDDEVFYQFQAEGIGLLFADMLSQAYGPKGSMCFYIDNTYQECMPQRHMQEAHEEGVALYSSPERFAKLKADLQRVFAAAKKEYPRLVEKPGAKDVREFFKLSTALFEVYSWMDPLHTDKAYREVAHNDVIKKHLDEITIIKDEYREQINELYLDENNFLLRLLEALEEQLGVPADDLRFYLVSEVERLFEKEQVSAEQLAARKDAYMLVGSPDGIALYAGATARSIIPSITRQWAHEGGDISGTVAHRATEAVVRGRVRKIPMDYSDFSRIREVMGQMQEGEVLVAQSTAPELMPACKKASAIVTDVGGLLSHAAIVSREMDKPCIVGTRCATKVLDDGDLVEVDSAAGVVRLLEKRRVFSPYMAREHSLFYCYVWARANQEELERLVGNLRNLLFIKTVDNPKVQVYYDLAELDKWFSLIGKRVNEEPGYFEDLVADYQEHWVPLKEMITEKPPESLDDLKRFYRLWIDWWVPMCVLFVIPEIRTIKEELRERALAIRTEGEKFSDDGDRTYLNFMKEQFPDFSELAYKMTPEEVFGIESLSEEQLDTIRGRDSFCLFNIELSKEYTGDIPLEETKVDQEDEFRGTPAFKGHASGRARVIRSKQELGRVQEGDILVTGMTSPDYVPALKRAAAIVTDEGGVMCHAAIVSRELKKPCIIGTKVATRVVRDGDYLEVDSEKGVVRRTVVDVDKWEFEFTQRDRHPILFADLWSRATVFFGEALGIDLPTVDYVYTSENKGYNHKAQKREIMQHIEDDVVSATKRLIASTRQAIARQQAFNDELPGTYSDEDALALWKEFDQVILRVIPYYFLPYYITEGDLLINEIELPDAVLDVTDKQNALGILTFPKQKVAFQKEQDSLYGLLTDFSDEKFERHLREFGWMRTFFLLPKEPLDAQGLREQLDELRQGTFLEEHELARKKRAENEKLYGQLYDLLDEKQRALVELAQELGHLLSWSVDETLRLTSEARPLFEAVARVAGIPFGRLCDYTSDEIVRLMQGERVRPPESPFVLISIDQQQRIIYGDAAQEVMEKLEEPVEQGSLSGTGAFPGQAEGKVVIALDAEQSKRVKEGDVLVTAMTSPDFVPAMRRCAAIVTDEGGLLSHAAIVAREFGKPCVIGTKRATRVLKDGDLVEVDAHAGTVRKL